MVRDRGGRTCGLSPATDGSRRGVYQVTALNLGNLDVPLAGMLRDGPVDQRLRIPVWAAAVTGNGIRMLIDTGIENPDRWSVHNPCWHERDETVGAALAEIGWRPRDVDIVVNTHLHFDHAGSNRRLPDARFFVSATEWAYSQAPAAHQRQLYDYEWVGGEVTRENYTLVDCDSFEIAPGVVLIQTPGHTPGHQSVLVDTAEGKLCVTGDAACLLDSFRRRIAPGDTTDVNSALASIEKIRRCSDRVLITHDPSLAKYQTRGFPAVGPMVADPSPAGTAEE
jgi:N-acyl homoserine lactone hydrolase